MTTKRRMDYRVDEDALKRMMAGDVTALEETVPPAEALGKEAVPFRETQDKKASASPSKKQTRKFPDEVTGTNEYRLRFWKQSWRVQEGRPMLTIHYTGLLPKYCRSLLRICPSRCF